METFDFNKKNDLKSPADFYKDCVEDFHKEANKHGVATRGLIFIPELVSLGEKTILSYLQTPYYQIKSGGDPEVYYRIIMTVSMEAGMAYAERWHSDFSTLNAYAEEVTLNGPALMAAYLWTKHFPNEKPLEFGENYGEAFYQKIYDRWLALHEPYWALEDPRRYTFNAMLAAYQLGVSMILEKYGY